jgi:hypothetical protein
MAYSKGDDGKTQIGPVSARGGIIRNRVMYVLGIGIVLAVAFMFVAVKLFH